MQSQNALIAVPASFDCKSLHILTNIEAARRYITALSYEQFKSNDPIIDAVQLRLQNASEAARRLNRDAPELMLEIEKRNPDVQWEDFRGFSSVSRHEYDIIEVGALWKELQPGGPAESVENAVRNELALARIPPTEASEAHHGDSRQ